MTLYAFDPKDPVLQTWMKIFPGTVKPLGDLEANTELMAHLRYPEDLFKAQRSILARYHVDDAGVFYTQEDSWQVPEDPTQPGRAPQPPHYQFGQLPGAVGHPVQPDLRAGGQQAAQHVRVHVRQQRSRARLRQDHGC